MIIKIKPHSGYCTGFENPILFLFFVCGDSFLFFRLCAGLVELLEGFHGGGSFSCKLRGLHGLLRSRIDCLSGKLSLVTRIGSTCGFCSLRLCGEASLPASSLSASSLCLHGELDLVVCIDLCHHLSDSVGAHALLDIFEVFLRRDTADECLGVLDLHADLRDNDVDDKRATSVPRNTYAPKPTEPLKISGKNFARSLES